MSEVVRVSSIDGRWAYVPSGTKAHVHLQRFIGAGLADSDSVEVRLKSDAGPLFWDLLSETVPSPSKHSIPTSALTDNGIILFPNEEIVFGKADGPYYNEFADLSWLNNPSLKQAGIPLSRNTLSEDDIVLTAWPMNKSWIPARARGRGRDLELELAFAAPKGQRCFVLDEDKNALLTASMKSDGSNVLRVIPPVSINSWLFSLGTNAVRQKTGRFQVSQCDDSFRLDDKKLGRSYKGKFRTSQVAEELAFLEFLLDRGGLGAILGNYEIFG